MVSYAIKRLSLLGCLLAAAIVVTTAGAQFADLSPDLVREPAIA